MVPTCKPLNGYKHGFLIGEHIQLFYGGEFAKNKFGNYTMQLLMSGEACREYENFLDGDFKQLLTFLLGYSNTSFTRLDIAIDVFDDSDIRVYDIEPILRQGHYISSMRRVKYVIEEERTATQVLPKGFGITLGSAGSNQLVMYDKRLERDARNQIDLDTDVWDRYEMRFIREKADAVAEAYVLAVENNDSHSFMKFASELLLTCLELKVPTNNKQRTRWPIHPKWEAFIGSVEKIDLNVKHKIDTTIEKRKRWSDRSYAKVNAGFFFGFEGEKETFMEHNYKQIIDGFERFENKDFEMINNYRKNKGLKKLTEDDFKDMIKMIKELLGEDND